MDDLIQKEIELAKKKFPYRRDCSNAEKHTDTCQGCVDVVVLTDDEFEGLLSSSLHKIKDEAKREAIEKIEDNLGIK